MLQRPAGVQGPVEPSPGEVDLHCRLPAPLAPLTVRGSAADTSVVGTLARDGVYEEHLLTLLARILAKDAVVVDVGANIGIVTGCMSRCAPHGRVYAFEPVPENVAFLEINRARNGLSNVVTVAAALGEDSGDTTVNVDPTFTAGAFSSTTGVTTGTAHLVPVLTLDEWSDGENLERLDLVKVDIEGSERSFLDGARKTFERFRPDLLVELNPIAMQRFRGSSWRDLVDTLYSLYRHVAYVRDDGSAVVPLGRGHLQRLLTYHGHLDLFCTSRAPGEWGPDAGRRAVRRGNDFVRAALRCNRFRAPRRWYVLEPTLSLAPSVSRLSGAPGASIDVPVTLDSGGDWISSALGSNPVLASYRWIDSAGERFGPPGAPIALPRPIRPGARRSWLLSATLPEDEGEYTFVPTLVQDLCAWLDDLEPAAFRGIPVTVSS